MTAVSQRTPKQCCICLGEIAFDPETGIEDAHNAWPIDEGAACGPCNWHRVVPARLLKQLAQERSL